MASSNSKLSESNAALPGLTGDNGAGAAPAIAIIGMAGRFPKADNIDQFWSNLCAGNEGISFFEDHEVAALTNGASNNPNYVKARGILEGADLFDASFFGINPREAEIMDPQHRIFLECAWEALESAGYDPQRYGGAIGVFAGMSMNTYWANNLMPNPQVLTQVGDYQAMLGNDKDFLPTRVSYKLNLRGPSLNIQTACSTSLVAVCVACQNLLNFECDVALAGAVSLSFPQKKGYLYQEGGIASPDGHCRTFDAKAAGTVAGEGVGIVVLKRLDEALADGDQIYAVIRGFALNNDGSNKIGYTAPSVDGQAEVIATALAMAGFAPETIGYVEAHGTGTPLGDPIEIEGLTKAFRTGTQANGFCAIGSVKSNIGHLDTAAGVAGLIKTVLALHHKALPPSLHFETPNPKIPFGSSPFYVNNAFKPWPGNGTPLRAGVSSFGIGGTNAHVVLEESPKFQVSSSKEVPSSNLQAPAQRDAQLLVVSAKTASALDQATANLAAYLKQHPQIPLADVAYTLQIGRGQFSHRRFIACSSVEQAIAGLEKKDSKFVQTGMANESNSPLVFMFPGQGAQHINMCRDLYQAEPLFGELVDHCCELLVAHLGLDLRSVLFPTAEQSDSARSQLTQTALAQPALFVIEYALARLWMSWGIKPEAMIGHSIGEYVAACLAEVFSLEEALKLVAGRGRMMQQLPTGAMLAVRLPEQELAPMLNCELQLAAINGVSLCVVSGPIEAVEQFKTALAQRSIASTPLCTSRAFHSAMMEPILQPFAELVNHFKLQPPKTPYISNVTGTWVTAAQATDPGYWASHLRHTVRFAEGLEKLLSQPERILLEVGPGQTLANLARQHPGRQAMTNIIASQIKAEAPGSSGNGVRPSSGAARMVDRAVGNSLARTASASAAPEDGRTPGEGHRALLSALGQLWLAGVELDWQEVHCGKSRIRVRLPSYPFERKRYWIAPARAQSQEQVAYLLSERSHAGKSQLNGNGKHGDGPELSEPDSNRSTAAQNCDPVEWRLKQFFSQLSGRALDDVPSTTTFTELGFDSLFLTQASLAIEKQFAQKVPFRMLLEELSTFEALAAHISSASQLSTTAAPVSPRKNGTIESAPQSHSEAPTQPAAMSEQASPIRRRLTSERAKGLLARLDELSDSEVESLLQDPELKELLS